MLLIHGLELWKHKKIVSGLDADTYFAHVYISWERGVGENISSVIRYYSYNEESFNKTSNDKMQTVMDRPSNRIV